MTLLTGETFEVVDVSFGPHHHLKGRNDFGTSGATARSAEQSEVIAFAEDQIGFRVQSRSYFTQSTVTATAFEAIFVPISVQCLN